MNQADLIPLWKALADSKRRRIIQLLHEQPQTTSEIGNHFEVSRFAVMRHLKVLEQAGLIKTRREGRQRWNFLNQDLFQQIQDDHLGQDGGNGYQLGEVLIFLARQEGAAARENSGPDQHTINLEVAIEAAPVRVFRALTEEINRWWSFRFVTDSLVFLEPRVGGRFYEAFNSGGGALYAFITYLKPGEEIRLNGSLGLAEEGENNIIRITLQPESPERTQLHLSHRFLQPTNVITVDTYKRSWLELLTQNLKPYVESGVSYQERYDGAQRLLPVV
jgi:DNA-binding transcriptional ArsR family regulator/uncharacterized protein YndB with AHSA1/START domain